MSDYINLALNAAYSVGNHACSNKKSYDCNPLRESEIFVHARQYTSKDVKVKHVDNS